MGCGVPSPRALKALGETVVHAKGDRRLSGGPSQRGAQHGDVSPRLWVSSAQVGAPLLPTLPWAHGGQSRRRTSSLPVCYTGTTGDP